MQNTLLLLCILAFVPLVFSLSLQVEPKSKECFSVPFAKHRQIKLNWQVTRGGLLDLNVIVRYDGPVDSPLREPQTLYEKLYFEKDHAPGLYDFITKKEGVYSFCFDNTMSRFTAKVFQFDYLTHDKWGLPEADDDEQEPSEVLAPMEKSARRISEELEVLSVHQQYMRNREMRHIWTQRSTNIRIFWFSVIESFALLAISFAQVFYIKRFFKSGGRLI
mmetsp:Transcript_114388/g.171050  ORF Transcript_114388/g.171050 Transcript_114388/m.171050 type:complete len:219 (+) Transcript_114388:17-673(+)